MFVDECCNKLIRKVRRMFVDECCSKYSIRLLNVPFYVRLCFKGIKGREGAHGVCAGSAVF